MRTSCIIVALSVFLSLSCHASSRTLVGYFSKESVDNFEKKVKPFFTQYSSCKDCEIVNLTPYNEKGEFDELKLQEKIASLPEDLDFVFFAWNEKSTDKNADLVKNLNLLVQNGKLVVAPAGVPLANDSSCPLNRTLMGQVQDSIIVGELTERDRLLPQCFYGPEMLTAVRPPKDLLGQGYAPLLFVSKFAGSWSKRKSTEWVAYFHQKKAKSRRLWPELEDFFPR